MAERGDAELDEFRDSQRRMWAGGDYRPVGRLLEPPARQLVARTGVAPGQRVLDVGTGSGVAAVAAAAAGGQVTGVDITDAWFDEARQQARAAGVHVDLQVGDAEDLPVEDESFDVVLSNFGAIFAPRHDVVASELARVCRPGGTIGLTAWTTGGSNGVVFSALADFLPPPPPFITPSIRWGDPEHVQERFGAAGVAGLRIEHATFPVEFASVEAFEVFTFDTCGAMVAARRTLEAQGTWEQARAAFRAAALTTNEAQDGSYRATWQYVLVTGTKP